MKDPRLMAMALLNMAALDAAPLDISHVFGDDRPRLPTRILEPMGRKRRWPRGKLARRAARARARRLK